MRKLAVLVVVAGLAVGACTTRPVGEVTDHPSGAIYTEMDLDNRNADILFVIDNSDSMEDEQQALIDYFDDFMAVLRGIAGGMPSVHIGVITSDVGIAPHAYGSQCQGNGDDGILHNRGGTCAIGGDHFIVDVSPDGVTRETNYTGTLEDAFACIANVGIGGCGFEQHLEAMKRALIDHAAGINGGFLREDAYLAVIIVSDEDDCSPADPAVFSSSDDDVQRFGAMTDFRCAEYGVTCAEGDVLRITDRSYTNCAPRAGSAVEHPQRYVDALLALKADPSLILVSGITGNPEPFDVIADAQGNPALGFSCARPATATAPESQAEPAVRLRWFLDQFLATHSTSASICDDDFRTALVEIADLLARRLRPCLVGPVDTTDLLPASPGLQLDCQVSYLRFKGTDNEEETVIPRCPMIAEGEPDTTVLPCWWVEPDTTSCAEAPNLALRIEKTTDPPAGTQLVARCTSH